MKASEKGKTTSHPTRKPNHLVNETSTYLQQHAYNPVQWYPWGEEALKRARAENKPILLSVGYAACHWCHVMEHESFEDDTTAALMNEGFINIKVDREERTDIDEIYMKAVQLMTGHGGWPMTVFLTPDLKPFFGGTYFPPLDHHGMPSFKRVLKQIQLAWQNNQDDLMASAGELTEHIQLMERVKADTSSVEESSGADYLNYGTISSALEKLLRNFDSTYGGFGGAPKFPHTFALELCLRAQDRASQVQDSRKADCLNLVKTSLNGMAIGGIHDHLGGGFARYSVDRKWLVPHFEKMLYDNALLARTYLDGYLVTGDNYWLRVARGILSFTKRELETEAGAFYSSLDADSEGVEGKYYVFTRREIIDILGERDGLWFADTMGVSEAGNFEHGTSVLHLGGHPEKLAKERDLTTEAFLERLEKLSQVVLSEREKRVRPGRDEKVLTCWNSLMLSAFVEAYQVTGEKTYLNTALKGMNFILENLKEGNRLKRVWGKTLDGKGLAKLDGYLDDYACTIQALLDLVSVDAQPRWLNTAIELADSMLTLFQDDKEGGFYYTASDHETLIVRPRSHFDGSVPSGTSSAAMSLLRLFHLTGMERFGKAAQAVLNLYGPNLTRLSDQFANLLCVLDFSLSKPREVAVVLPEQPQEEELAPLFQIYKNYSPGKVVAVGREKEVTQFLFKDRPALGKTTIYICRNFSCQKPISDEKELEKELEDW